MLKNDFNFIAPYYDGLARMVFGKSLKKAQQEFLDVIPEGSHLLIVGGGTGWILNYLDDLNKKLIIDYLEISKGMLDRSKARAPFKHIYVSFRNGKPSDLIETAQYDAVITNFFLDVFNIKNLPVVVSKINTHLRKNGKWIITDFYKTSIRWHGHLIALMYRFFQLTSNLEGNKLLDFDLYFENESLELLGSQKFFHGMIQSKIYRK